MKSLMTSIFAILPLAATAAPEFDLKTAIDRSYNPQIEIRKLSTGRSLYGCYAEELEILGQDPVTFETRKVSVSLYRPRTKTEGQPAVIILPPTGGVNILDRGYANEFCASGLTVALVSGWDHQGVTSLDFSMHNHGALRALTATRHTVELLQAQGSRSIGILGTSIGAVAGSFAHGYEPRITSGVFIVGCARLADVVAVSDESGAAKLRQQRMRKLGITTIEEYKRAVRKGVYIEPSAFVDRSGTKRALVVSADADTTVPTEYQYELARLLQADRHIQLRGNHVQVVKDAFRDHRSEIKSFFLKTL